MCGIVNTSRDLPLVRATSDFIPTCRLAWLLAPHLLNSHKTHLYIKNPSHYNERTVLACWLKNGIGREWSGWKRGERTRGKGEALPDRQYALTSWMAAHIDTRIDQLIWPQLICNQRHWWGPIQEAEASQVTSTRCGEVITAFIMGDCGLTGDRLGTTRNACTVFCCKLPRPGNNKLLGLWQALPQSRK